MRSIVFLAIISSVMAADVAHVDMNGLFCDLCKSFIERLDELLKHGDDIEKASRQFCQESLPSALVESCNKIFVDNLVNIIAMLKNHEKPKKVCSTLRLC